MKRSPEMQTRLQIASWCREESVKVPPAGESKKYWKGYKDALVALAEYLEAVVAESDAAERPAPGSGVLGSGFDAAVLSGLLKIGTEALMSETVRTFSDLFFKDPGSKDPG